MFLLFWKILFFKEERVKNLVFRERSRKGGDEGQLKKEFDDTG
jgi:hypothetical protein